MMTETSESSDSGAAADEIASLARQYLSLWKDQWSKLAEDPANAEALARLYAMMGQQTAAVAPIFAALGQGMTGAGVDASGGTGHDAAAGSPPTAASSDGGDVRLVDIHRRLAALEERLARLESGSDNTDP